MTFTLNTDIYVEKPLSTFSKHRLVVATIEILFRWTIISVSARLSKCLQSVCIVKMVREIDETCLIIRNFPHSFSQQEIHDFVQMFDPIDIDIFKNIRTAFATFGSKEHTRHILQLLHQEQIDGYRLFVEFAMKHRSRSSQLHSDDVNNSLNEHIDIECNTAVNVNDIIRRLYGMADNLNVSQPPSPSLFYEYPKANRSIIDSISIALESKPHFYVQVLHLMNRMNLDPPFVAGDTSLQYESTKRQMQSTSSQTDDVQWKQVIRNKRKLIESGESELESSSNESDEDEMPRRHKERRVCDDKKALVKTRQHNIWKMQRVVMDRQPIERPVTSTDQVVSNAFDLNESSRIQFNRNTNMKIIVPDKLNMPHGMEVCAVAACEEKTTASQSLPMETASDLDDSATTSTPGTILSDADLQENRIPSDQLKVHPLFLNYTAGDISNRLYIKNIAKDVTENDLRVIYERYLETNCNGDGAIRSIDIRLMSTGRMKGQAFVTFDGPYLNCDVDEEFTSDLLDKYRMVERAVRETNGYILKGKPMIVQYGKRK